MILTINDIDYEIKFGIGFVRRLDEKYYTKGVAGAQFGLGLESRLPLLLAGDTLVLAEFLYMGTAHLDKRPKQADIDDFIDTVGDIDALFDEVVDELKKQNATRRKTLKITEAFDKDEKETAEG